MSLKKLFETDEIGTKEISTCNTKSCHEKQDAT
jgi:hypothetical protein